MPQVVQAYKMQATMNNEMVYDGDFYVCEVQYQVVAGTNYIITVAPDEEDCEEGETAELKVFCPLAYTGELCQLTEPAVLPDSFFSE